MNPMESLKKDSTIMIIFRDSDCCHTIPNYPMILILFIYIDNLAIIRWVHCNHIMAHPQVGDGGDCPQDMEGSSKYNKGAVMG